MTPGQAPHLPQEGTGHPAPPADGPQAGYGPLRAPAGAIPSQPDPAVDAAARAAHRSQFVDPNVENMVWTSAAASYRTRWHTLANAAITAAAPHIAAAERRKAADGLRTLAARHRQQPGHNGDQTAGIDWAADHLDPRQTEPGS